MSNIAQRILNKYIYMFENIWPPWLPLLSPLLIGEFDFLPGTSSNHACNLQKPIKGTLEN